MFRINTPAYQLRVGGADGLFTYTRGGAGRVIRGPVFEVDGEDLAPVFASVALTAKEKVRLLPALNIPFELLKRSIEIIKKVCEEQ